MKKPGEQTRTWLTTSPLEGFFSEGEMRHYIVANLDSLERGLHLYQNDRLSIEFPCMSCCGLRYGRMDVLAVDKDGAFVVIECKVTKACSSVLGQLLGYMAWVDRHMPESGLPVRGMIVAREVSPALALAVKYLSLVSLMVFECPGRKRLQRVM